MKQTVEFLNEVLKATIYIFIIMVMYKFVNPINCREWNDKYINHKTETDVQKQVEFNERVKQLGIEQKKDDKEINRLHP